jgi:molybdate transport system substrate-binding protein
MLRNIPPALTAFVGSAAVLAGLLFGLHWLSAPGGPAASREPLVVYCAAGLKAPLESIARAYEAEHGQAVELRLGGSQTVLTNLELARQGDLFLPGDDSYIRAARDKGLLAEVLPLARMRAVVLVGEGNPRKITAWQGLTAEGVRVAQANPDAAAVGLLTRQKLQAAGKWEALQKRTVVFKGTVNDVANAVRLGAADAGVVWDTVAALHPRLAAVKLPELEGVTARVQIAVLKSCARPAEALRFARYVAAHDRGLRHFTKHGFAEVEEGDRWAEVPEVRLLLGTVLRPAVEDTLKAFERREGVRVTRVYNGCGILVGQMKAGDRPDLFFACDAQFMNPVRDLFGPPTAVSTNQLVIAVPKGNPHGLSKLRSLGKKGLKVGVGHEQQCALGVITKETFVQTGVYAAVMKNVVVQAPAGDLLVNQLRAGALDAAVTYKSNVTPYREELEALPVTGIPCAAPTQPLAVGRGTAFPQLTRRLVQALQSSESRQRFEELGFGWEVK